MTADKTPHATLEQETSQRHLFKDKLDTCDIHYYIVTWLLLSFIFIFSVFRAKSQPIAHDEAYTFVHHISGGIGQILQYSPNNHFLYTLAAALFVKVFGVSEFVLRAPTLIGMLAYLVGSYCLCRRLFGTRILLPLISSLLVANPMVLDFLVAGRGYGLALGFLLLAMASFANLSSYGSMSSTQGTWQWRCAFGSICLGLSVAANLSYLIPACSLGLSFAVMIYENPILANRCILNKFAFLVRWLMIPGVTVALFILWPYLIQVQTSTFMFGYESLTRFLREFMNSSLLYKWTDETYANLGAVWSARGSWQHVMSSGFSFVALPLLTLSMFLGSVLAGYGSGSSAKSTDITIWRQLFCRATSGAIVALCMFHFFLHDKYPVIRACLYLIPLFTVSTALIAREVAPRVPASAKVVGMAVALLIASDYLASLQMSRFRYNVYDTRSREAFLSILKDVQARGLKDVKIGGTWWYEPELNFYRTRYKASQIESYDVKDPSAPFVAQNLLQPFDYDYFCFLQDRQPDLSSRPVRVIFHDEKTGMIIAVIEK